jgi:hypothetical protein
MVGVSAFMHLDPPHAPLLFQTPCMMRGAVVAISSLLRGGLAHGKLWLPHCSQLECVGGRVGFIKEAVRRLRKVSVSAWS